MSKKIIIATIILIALGAAFYYGWVAQKQPEKYTGPVEKITVGISKFGPEVGLPFYIAQEDGYFRDNGLEVLLEPLQTGVQIDQAVLEKKVDIGFAADFNFVADSFEHTDLKILASIVRIQTLAMIVRTDKGISKPADLKGKRIGIIPKTALEFFFNRFLVLNNISPQDVEIVPLSGGELKQALVDGNIDAIMFTKRIGRELTQELKDKILYWPAHNDQPLYVMASTHKDSLSTHKETFEKFLDALIKAEAYIKTNPADALTIAKKYISPSDYEYLASDFGSLEVKIDLDQAMVIYLENQARWTIANKFTDKTVIPNYLDYIYFDALEAIKPEAITIIH